MKFYKISDLKNFMNQLLLSDCFDWFLMEEGIIVTSNTFRIDGHVQKEFFSKEELEDQQICPYDFSPWKDIRPLCVHLIRGKRTPLFFKFVLLLQPQYMGKILSAGGFQDNGSLVRAFTLTVKYDGSFATLMTGLSTASFLPDKSPEQLWDTAFSKFLQKNQLDAEEV